MRDLLKSEVNKWRLVGKDLPPYFGGYEGDETCGAFLVPIGSFAFAVVAASGEGWDHVSVSLSNRCPSYVEMDRIKRLFFKDDEVAMQLHVTPKEHISVHPFCLHLWRPQYVGIPLPPTEFV